MRLFLALILAIWAMPSLAQTQPNIVMFVADDLAPRGADRAFLPETFEQIADQGIVFTNAFPTFPLCTPSRVSLFTGQGAWNHGIKKNSNSGGGFSAWKSQDDNAIQKWLGDAGYRTGIVGKLVNNYNDESYVGEHWDEWFVGTDEYYDYTVSDNGTKVTFGDAPEDYSTDVFRDRAIAFVSDPDPSPFFLYLAFNTPHGNAVPAQRHLGAYATEALPIDPSFDEQDVSDKPNFIQNLPKLANNPNESFAGFEDLWRRQLEAGLSMDEAIAAVIEAVDQAGKGGNTCYIFLSDHGNSFYDHRDRGKGMGYESHARTTAMMRCPGMTPGVRDQLVILEDFTATIVALAGATPGRVLDGADLSPLIASDTAPWRSAFYTIGKRPSNSGSKRWRGIRTNDWKYINHSNDAEELYDLQNDPFELENLVGSGACQPELCAMRDLYNELKGCSGEQCWKQ